MPNTVIAYFQWSFRLNIHLKRKVKAGHLSLLNRSEQYFFRNDSDTFSVWKTQLLFEVAKMTKKNKGKIGHFFTSFTVTK